jgi:DNA-binding LacI/PurR family transcriptional regulator
VGHYDFDRAQEAVRRLFADDAPDALLAGNDHMAIAALDVLRQELGLSVPQDVAVVGFDDVPQAAWGAYRLTTIRQEVEPMVDATVALLREQMHAELQPRDIVVPCSLIERATVRASP